MINNLERLKLPGPIRGLNDTDDEKALPRNMLVDVLNFKYEKNGITTRDGFSAYSTSGLPAEYINLGFAYTKEDANSYLLIVSKAGVYKETTTGVFSTLTTGLVSGYPFYAAILSDLAILSSRGNAPLKYDGTTLKALAITEPASGPTVALGVAGSLTGDYRYKITFVSSAGAETMAGPASASITTTSDKVALSVIPTGGTDVVRRKIYRTLADESLFYFLDSIEDNTTTTYTDDIPDAQLSTDLEPSINDQPPSELMFLNVYKQYLFGVIPSEPTALYHSHSGLPELFYTDPLLGYKLSIGGADGKPIIGTAILRENFYVFKQGGSTWPIVGSTPDDFQVASQPINQSYSLYHRSIAYIDFGEGTVAVGVGDKGLFAFNGYSFKNLGVQPEAAINITGFFNSLDKNQLAWATGFDDKDEHCYRCSVRRSGMGYNDRELVWDYLHNSITIYDIKGNSLFEWKGQRIFGSSQTAGGLFRIGGFNDAGVAISQKAEAPWWAVGEEFYSSFRFLYINATQWGDYSPQVDMYIDAKSQATSLSLAGGYDWGSNAWVTDAGTYFITADIPVRNSKGVNYKGRFFKFKIEHDGLNEPITVLDASLLFTRTKELYRGNRVTGTKSMGV